MLKKICFIVLAFCLGTGAAFAQVDVNKADVVALDGVKGIGPATSKTILDERAKGGSFKSWTDFESRVKGISGKKAAALSNAGLRVNGEARPADAAVAANAKAAAAKPATAK